MGYYDDELMHYGVKGMKWGVRRNRGISGTIRDVQRNRAVKDLSKVNSQQRQVKRELAELRGYDRNPSKIGRSKISTAIRRSQIKSLEKTQNKLNSREKDNQSAIKELDQIERYQAKKKQFKQDVKTARKKGIQVDVELDQANGGLKVSNHKIGNREITPEYADRIMRKMRKDSAVRTLAGTTAVLAGSAFVTSLLDR